MIAKQNNLSVEDQIANEIDKEINKNQKILQNIRGNSSTKLSDAELLNMYSSFTNDGMILF